MHQKQVFACKRGVNLLSTEMLIKLADQEKNLANEILDLVILKHRFRFRELTCPKAAIG